MQPTRQVLLVDDHPVVRLGLRLLIDSEPDLEVCGEAEDTAEALEHVLALQPDLVVVDLSLKGSNGLELIKTLHTQTPGVAMLAISMHDETLYAERALRAGAHGYIMKQEAPERVLQAIRQVLQGEIHVSTRMASRLLRALAAQPVAQDESPLARLSDRELEIYEFLGQGYRTRQVADILHLSVKTVESHRANIMKKLQLSSGLELVRYATKWVNTPGSNTYAPGYETA